MIFFFFLVGQSMNRDSDFRCWRQHIRIVWMNGFRGYRRFCCCCHCFFCGCRCAGYQLLLLENSIPRFRYIHFFIRQLIPSLDLFKSIWTDFSSTALNVANKKKNKDKEENQAYMLHFKQSEYSFLLSFYFLNSLTRLFQKNSKKTDITFGPDEKLI